MYRAMHVFVLCTLFFARNLAEFNEEQSNKYLNCLVDYLNKLPNQQYVYEDGTLVNTQKIDDNTYALKVNVKANPVENGNGFKLFRCTGVIKDSIENGIFVQKNSEHCVDDIGHHESVPNNNDVLTHTVTDDVSQIAVTVDPRPVKLDNEVQSENTVTSGEQFIAIPRVTSHAACFGCASHVDTGAPGVQDLALLAVRHLDKHEPDVKHTLSSVVDVERQVQIVNGVRFILTLKIDFDNCTVVNTDTCRESKACKISILEKPWVKLPDGSKFRSILSNNCTEEWLFGDNGDVLPTIPEGSQENKDNNEILVNPTDNLPNVDNKQASSTPDYDKISKTGSMDDILRQVHDYELQGPIPSSERALTAEELKDLEQQIIPSRDLLPPSTSTYETRAETFENNDHALNQKKSHTQLDLNSSPNHEPSKEQVNDAQRTFLSDDKRRALDDLINYFNFDTALLPKVHDEQIYQQNFRVKRHIYDMNSRVINTNKIVNTEETVTRRQGGHSKVIGGPETQDPNDEKYRNLAEESLRQYHAMSYTQYIHQIVEMVKVTTQLVSGTITKIDFKISPTNCLTNDTRDVSSCEIENSNNTRRCHSEIYDRPWVKGSKEITVTCGKLYKGGSKKLSRSNRSIVGGVQEQDPNEHQYMTLAVESLHKYQLMSNTPYVHTITKIDKVTKQVVSGLLTNLYFKITPTQCLINDLSSPDGSNCEVQDRNVVLQCHSEIWERKWLKDGKQINITCKNDTSNANARKKRNVGDAREQDPNDSKYKVMAEKSLYQYKTFLNSGQHHKIIQINKVTTQVVSGTVTKIDFTASPTNCLVDDLESEKLDETNCEIKDSNNIFDCHADIWERPWLSEDNDKLRIDLECEKQEKVSRVKRSIPGGLKEQDANKDEYRELAQKSLQKYQLLSNAEYVHELITVDRVTTQVVSGSLTRIDFTISPTSCLAKYVSGASGSKVCEIKNETLKCFAKVWDRPWMKEEVDKQQIDVNCAQNEEQLVRTKRSFMTGGLTEQDANKDEYRELAQKSMQKYQLLSSAKSAHKLITVDRVTTQVVSGYITRINFTISPTSCSVSDASGAVGSDCDVQGEALKCFASVWDRPWLKEEADKQQIDVNCAQIEEQLVRTKRSFMTGGLTEQDANKDEYRELAQKSLQKYHVLSSAKSAHKLITVDRVTTQVVSGYITRINFTISPTSCSVSDASGAVGSDCDVQGEALKCFASVWDRPWLKEEDDKQQIDVNCASNEEELVRTKRFDDLNPKSTHKRSTSSNGEMLLGTSMSIDNTDSHALAEIALKHIEAKYPHPYKQKVVRISKLEKFESGGIHYRLKLEVAITDCLALSHQNNCNVTEDMGDNKLCRVKVWVQSSFEHWPNIRVSCDHQNSDLRHLFVQIQAEHLFGNFLDTFKPHYLKNLSEVTNRFKIFRENLRKIHELNTYEHGTAAYGVTRFADLTYEEFSKKHLGLRPNLRRENEIPMAPAPIPDVALPEMYDWRDHGAVTEVKNQGSCGSCWAFSVTGNVEGQWKLKSGQLVSLSEQELVDCDKLDDGCNGGLPDNAYRAIEQLGGLETEAEYPYEGSDDTCAFNKSLTKVSISGALNITTNETGMAQWLVKNGPISIGINANAMQFYMGGISHPWKALCSPKNLDHGVLIVGYGKKEYPIFNKHMPYWIVKNSWGTSWGEQGYYRVYRGDGTCGLNQMASSAVV